MHAEDRADAIAWDERGLAPALVQNATTGEMLMVAWMNREALARTRDTGLVHFYSRSRDSLWQKGETSGNALSAREIRTDCDADAILVLAEPAGPACHKGVRSCFHQILSGAPAAASAGADAASAEAAPDRGALAAVVPPAEDDGPGAVRASILDRVYAVLEKRRESPAARSYTASLLQGGADQIVSKIAEEQSELAEELPSGDRARVIHETADLLFHVWVGLLARDIPPAEVWRELERRFGVGGHDEKATRPAAPAPGRS